MQQATKQPFYVIVLYLSCIVSPVRTVIRYLLVQQNISYIIALVESNMQQAPKQPCHTCHCPISVLYCILIELKLNCKDASTVLYPELGSGITVTVFSRAKLYVYWFSRKV